MPKILLLGSGNQRHLVVRYKPAEPNEEIIRVDFDPRCKPDVMHDLNVIPYPFKNDEFDQIHAYEVMEHLGQQGDWRAFFAQFTELARILKPEGWLIITSPKCTSPWLWGDPGHTRYIGLESMSYLDQSQYILQVGKTQMTDYRHVYQANFEVAMFDTEKMSESNII